MTEGRRRRTIVTIVLCIVVVIGVLLVFASQREGAQPKIRIAILSSVPLQWGDADIGAIARGEATPDPLVERLSGIGRLTFVDNIAQIQAARPSVALLIQPRALSPDELVRLDNWVRAGGRLLIFADPALQWPSSRPLGDPQRPLFTSLLSPLFTHWGLELAFPMNAEGQQISAQFGGHRVVLLSPGEWQALPNGEAVGNCRIAASRQLAECRPGKGQVLLVADADLLQASLWQSALPKVDANENMDWLREAIAKLDRGVRIVSRVRD